MNIKTSNWLFGIMMIVIIVISFLFTSCEKDSISTSNEIVDFDGNVYHSVIIGDQEWLVENLMTTHFNNGSDIKLIIDDNEWVSNTMPGYCWRNNIKTDESSSVIYNFYCVNTGKLAPKGWHIPSDEEWKELEVFIGMSEQDVDQQYWRGTGLSIFLESMKWFGLPYGTGDIYGFSALPSGGRNGYSGRFIDGAYWWTSTPYDDNFTWGREINSDDEFKICRSKQINQSGFTVRCVRNK